MGEMDSANKQSKHRRYRRLARRAYRVLILACIFALICAVLIWYASDTPPQ